MPTDPARTGLAAAAVPEGFAVVPADELEPRRLQLLDDALRQDVPGTDGWTWDDAGFLEETYESPDFDPSTYLVAVEQTTGEPVAIARVWNRPDRPRLGFVGVLEPHRRQGLARALLAQVFAVLGERGATQVFTEYDERNVASKSLLSRLGAHRLGGSLELIRRRSSA